MSRPERVGAGAGGASGADAGTYMCTPGAVELCDGRDDNCDLDVDEGAVYPSQCSGRAWGGHGDMLCDFTNYTWDGARAECESRTP